MQIYHILEFCTNLFSHFWETKWTGFDARKKKNRTIKISLQTRFGRLNAILVKLMQNYSLSHEKYLQIMVYKTCVWFGLINHTYLYVLWNKFLPENLLKFYQFTCIRLSQHVYQLWKVKHMKFICWSTVVIFI